MIPKMTQTDNKASSEALEKAIQNGDIGYAIQPIFDARDSSLFAGEALIRWHKKESAAPPSDFLPQLCSLEWREPYQSLLLEQKLQTAERLRNHAKVDTYFNFVVESLLDDQCWKGVQENVSKNAIAFDNIVIELSEMNLFEHDKIQLDRASGRLQELQSLAPGVKFALDDFGSGLSNLNRLRMWNISVLKLDIQLISGIDQDKKGQILLRNLRKMASDLDILLVAEGVETKEEEEVLLNMDIYLQQGFLRAAPMSIDAFTSTHYVTTSAGENDAR